jgi:hypothetical protein
LDKLRERQAVSPRRRSRSRKEPSRGEGKISRELGSTLRVRRERPKLNAQRPHNRLTQFELVHDVPLCFFSTASSSRLHDEEDEDDVDLRVYNSSGKWPETGSSMSKLPVLDAVESSEADLTGDMLQSMLIEEYKSSV